jgi:uncharacterized protein
VPHPPEVRVDVRAGSSGPEITVRNGKSTYTAKRANSVTEEEVQWQSEGVTISGSLFKPAKGRGPFPVVVFVHGSGPVSRGSPYGLHAYLAHHGFASLVYDKRGVGRSGGVYVHQIDSARLALLANDAIEGIKLINKRSDIDTTRIGVWGISQAGWIVPIVAAKSPSVDYTVIVSGPTTTVDQEGYFSRLTGDDGDGTRLPREEIRQRMREYVARDFDPMPFLRQQRAPGLWIYGGKDDSVPVEMSVENLKQLRAEGKPFQLVMFPGGQHVIWETEDGSRQYTPLIKRLVPDYLQTMVRWMSRGWRPIS